MTPCEARSVASTGGDYSVFGARKMHAMRGRPEIAERHGAGHVARCTVERLMRDMGLHGVRRAKSPRTTRSAPKGAVPGRPGEPSLRRFQAERAVGVGHHICAYFRRLGARRAQSPTCTPGGSWAGGPPRAWKVIQWVVLKEYSASAAVMVCSNVSRGRR